MKQNRKGSAILKKMLSVLLTCGLMLTLFLPGMTVSAAEGSTVTGLHEIGGIISSGGIYVIPEEYFSSDNSCITISTKEPVTLLPYKTGGFYYLSSQFSVTTAITCTVPGVDLTLNGIEISSAHDHNLIKFTGTKNILRLQGENRLETNQVSSTADIRKSIIHVPKWAELSIYGPGILTAYSTKEYSTKKFGATIGGNADEACGTINVMGGELYDSSVDSYGKRQGGYFNGKAGFIGSGGGTIDGINIFGGRVYGALGYDGDMVQVGESQNWVKPIVGPMTIDGDCFIYGKVEGLDYDYTFTKGFLNTTYKVTVCGGNFTYTQAEAPYLPYDTDHNYSELLIAKGAQLTIADDLEYGYPISNLGTIVINQEVQLTTHKRAFTCQGQLINYGTFFIDSDATFELGTKNLYEKAKLVNYSSGVVENNGSFNCSKNNLIANMGEIRGNALTGEPVYDQVYSSYNFKASADSVTQDVETDLNLSITPDKDNIKYLDYDNAGIKVTAITQPQGVTGGLTLKEVKDDGTVSVVETGKLWNDGKGFVLPKDQSITRQMKLLGSKLGEYEVTYTLVNLEDNSEITSNTLKYTVAAPAAETLSTLTGITINGKAIEPFDKSTLSYETEIRPEADELTVTAAMSHPGASYTVQKPDSPVEGINLVTITCVSEDKSSTTVYTVKVNKPKLIEGIKELYLDGELCEDFDSQKTNSTITISDAQIGSRFTYILANPSDRVLSDTLSSKALKVGNNVCMVKIGDSRGVLKVQYVITVKVVKGAVVPGAQLSDNTKLKSLTVNGTAAELTNDPAKIINVTLNDSRSVATIKAEAEDSKAAVTCTASLSIKPGNNLTTITVKSSDQSKQAKYTLCIRYQTLSNVPTPSTGTSGNTALKSVTVGGVEAVLPAAGSILVDVGRITEQPKIDVITEDPQATVQLKYLSANVKTGNNMVQITVQSSDKSKKATYMLVYRVS